MDETRPLGAGIEAVGDISIRDANIVCVTEGGKPLKADEVGAEKRPCIRIRHARESLVLASLPDE